MLSKTDYNGFSHASTLPLYVCTSHMYENITLISVDLCSLGGTPSPSVRGLEVKAPQVGLSA